MRRPAGVALVALLLVRAACADDWKDADIEGAFALAGTQDGRAMRAELLVRKAQPGHGFIVTRRAFDVETGAVTCLTGTGERDGSKLDVSFDTPVGIVGALAGSGSKKSIEGRYDFDEGGETVSGSLEWKGVHEAGSRPAKKLLAGPWIQDVRAKSAVVLFVTKKKGEGVVEFGSTPSLGRKASAGGDERHRARLDGLEGTRVFYRILVDGGAATPIESFALPAAPGTAFSVTVVGDSGTGGKDQRAVAQALCREESAFTIHAGNFIYPHGTRKMNAWVDKFFDPYQDLLRSRWLAPTFGNHEAEEPRAFEDQFVVPANNPAKTQRYYSYEWGDARFVHVDTSGLTFNETDQKNWLRQQLASNTRKWLVLVTHVPLRSSMEEGDVKAVREGLKPILEGAKVDLIVTAHKHRYERARVLGACQVLTGGGGADLSDVDKKDKDIERVAKKLNFVSLAFSPEKIRGRAIDEDGDTIDEFSVSK